MGEFLSFRLFGRVDPRALEEGVKGLRALGGSVPGPGMDVWTFTRTFASSVGRTDGRMDGRTEDRPSYRDARTHLKIKIHRNKDANN